jgi:flavodoxin
MKKEILIAYYSWHGNTKKIAELIHHETGGTLFEIETVQKYSADYENVVAQAKDEIRTGFRPKLKAMPKNASFDVIFMGSPIWWYTMAPPLASFISRFDLNGKTVAPFYTHGGGGGGSFEQDLAKMCSNCILTEGLGTYNGGGRETIAQIRSWLSTIDLESR